MSKLLSLKSVAFVLFLITLLITIYAKFISQPAPQFIPEKLDEKFDTRLSELNTPEKLDALVSEKFKSSNYDTAKTLLYIDEILRNKFFHSYSELSFNDNWIAFICGEIFWRHFLNPVVPKDIIRFPMAGCSQQAILFQDQLHRLNIPVSSIQFYPTAEQTSGHYAISAYYGHKWHYFDSNLEPIIVDSLMPSVEEIIERKLYDQMYTRPVHQDFKEYFLNKNYKRILEEPGSRGEMFYFQTITQFLSNWFWLIFLILYCFLLLKQSPQKKQTISSTL